MTKVVITRMAGGKKWREGVEGKIALINVYKSSGWAFMKNV